MVSSYLVACYLGNSVPIIGIGILSRFVDADTANIIFAFIIALLGLLSLREVRRG